MPFIRPPLSASSSPQPESSFILLSTSLRMACVLLSVLPLPLRHWLQLSLEDSVSSPSRTFHCNVSHLLRNILFGSSSTAHSQGYLDSSPPPDTRCYELIAASQISHGRHEGGNLSVVLVPSIQFMKIWCHLGLTSLSYRETLDSFVSKAI